MKLFLCIVTTCVTLTAAAQSRFDITGQLTGKDTGTIVIWYTNDTNRIQTDTCLLDGGRFHFSGRVLGATEALIWTELKAPHFDHPSIIRFLLQPGRTHIAKTVGERPATITGAQAQSEKEQWDRQKAQVLNKVPSIKRMIDSLYRSSTQGVTYTDSMITMSHATRAARHKMDIDYLVSHPHSYVSCFLLGRMQRWIPVDSVALLYETLADSVRQSSLGYEVLKYVYPLTNNQGFRNKYPLIDKAFNEKLAAIGSLHDFKLSDSSGGIVDLSQFKGKYLVIDVWTSWCSGCINNMPVWNALVEQYDPRQVQFLKVSLDPEVAVWKKALRKHQPAGITLIDTTSFRGLFAVYNKVLWVGKCIVADPNGRILTYDIGAGDVALWRKTIYSYIKK